MNEKDLNSIYPNPQEYKPDGEIITPKRGVWKLALKKIIVLIILIILGLLAWRNWDFIIYYYNQAKQEAVSIGTNIAITSPVPQQNVSTKGWQTFDNSLAHYKVNYPADWVYYHWKASGVSSSGNAYLETVGFDLGPKTDDNAGGGLRINTYMQNAERTISDIKDQSEFTFGPNKLKEEVDVNINGVTFRKLVFTRFIPEPENYDPRDRQVYLVTGNGDFSYAISLSPYRSYDSIDQAIVGSFKPY